MFTIEPINPPDEVQHPGGMAVLTHRLRTLDINLAAAQNAPEGAFEGPTVVTVREMRGFLVDGKFQDWGDHVLHTMDRQGLEDLLADTEGGKPAGEFRTDDILPGIQRRKQAVEAAKQADKEAKEAAAEAARQQELRALAERGNVR